MIKLRDQLIRKLKNPKGQVALFVALIFQILFIFFAMVINVGLLVHHKINLQNSVDLAAYYGAMKQAENMNAIAHINYQIRQSWKLLAWRYRMVGTAGDFSEHPVDKIPSSNLGIVPGRADTDDINPAAKDFYDAPSFCATYVPFKPMPKENTCRDLKDFSGVKVFGPTPTIAGFHSVNVAMTNISEKFRNLAFERCRYFGAFNYRLLAQWVVGYNMDQADRMLLISTISRSMSNETEDFFDLDGESVKKGIRATLENNLTAANKSGIQSFKVYNSLGADGCNNPAKDEMPAKWLVPIRIAPAFSYVDTVCNAGGSNTIDRVPRELASDRNNWPAEVVKDQGHALWRDISELSQFVGLRSQIEDPYNYSMGVEKNPWCMAYVGVSAVTRPNIPFSPLGAVDLKARAFFKPFGGRMGPWYESQWPSGSERSAGGGKIDPNLPPRIFDTGNIGDPKDPTRAGNYSRFVGDQYGLKSRNLLYQFGRAIFRLDPTWAQRNADPDFKDTAPNFGHWAQLPFEFARKSNGNGDLLAWSEEVKGPSRFRALELLAILPDQFDMAYYSIEPDFYHNYYKRIKEKFMPKANPGFDKSIRPDIGYHKDYKQGDENLEEFSVKDQFKVLKSKEIQTLSLDIDQKLTYLSKDWKNVLTGWADNGLLDYSLNTEKLGKCTVEPKYDGETPVPPTSGNCIVGGTSGYSVKMISSDYLNSELQLGGDNSGKAKIKNAPPADF